MRIEGGRREMYQAHECVAVVFLLFGAVLLLHVGHYAHSRIVGHGREVRRGEAAAFGVLMWRRRWVS